MQLLSDGQLEKKLLIINRYFYFHFCPICVASSLLSLGHKNAKKVSSFPAAFREKPSNCLCWLGVCPWHAKIHT